MMTGMRAEKKGILQATRHLDNLGLRGDPDEQSRPRVRTHVMYTMPTADAAESSSRSCPP